MESNANPACPKCQSPHTERQDWAELGPTAIYRCFKCGHVWHLPADPKRD